MHCLLDLYMYVNASKTVETLLSTWKNLKSKVDLVGCKGHKLQFVHMYNRTLLNLHVSFPKKKCFKYDCTLLWEVLAKFLILRGILLWPNNPAID